MTCLETRRLLLVSPRTDTPGLDSHLASCESCARLRADLKDLDRDIVSAAQLPLPDGLADRILLKRHSRPVWQYAAAASVALATVVLSLFGADVVHAPGFARTAEAVGPTHPGVNAIAQVVDDELERPYAVPADPAEARQGLKRLGLALKKGNATAYYVGRCEIPGGGTCERIVVSTPEAQANVMLVPDSPLGERVLVSDRRMTALVHPGTHGGYIVVADSAKIARRMEKLFVKG